MDGEETIGPDDAFAAADRLALAAELDELSRAADWLEGLAARDALPERTLFKLQLSLEEALANIITYGVSALPAGEARIAVDYRQDRDMARLRISDNGPPFDPTAREEVVNPASIEEAEVGGHGIQLMRHLLDEFSYCYAGGHNRLILGSRLVPV
ncbi:ATP-binding protein [Ancylobacter lacus]|uniref:ATP-binding protein n=1 Tax=Ancylobacter lacus TaxID=2579970 RepID=UPI001BD18BAF|nr:ATP-binding protein [Ancylobacter lacus]MBS7538322.1 ATP-binding protein [Ancylobacter lacus]